MAALVKPAMPLATSLMGAVAAAGVQAQRLASLCQGTSQSGGSGRGHGSGESESRCGGAAPAAPPGLDALDTAALTGFGVDDEDMSHTRVLFSSGFRELWTKFSVVCPKALCSSIADFTEKAKRGAKLL